MSESKRQNPPNARWWTWLNGGWVKLTLKPGQSLERCYGGTTDEGWNRTRERWSYNVAGDGSEPIIIVEGQTEGLDCDGRYCLGGSSYCPISMLTDRMVECAESGEIYFCPQWGAADSWQRDYEAEKAGY